jgi:hypothetical protein
MMPLSDREQEMLDQIEQALYAEDPKFAASVRSAQRSRGRRWFALCVLGVLAGLGTVLAGLTMKGTGVGIGLGVAGFLLIVASCFYAATLLTARATGTTPPGKDTPTNISSARKEGVRSRMEDRLRRRFDED